MSLWQAVHQKIWRQGQWHEFAHGGWPSFTSGVKNYSFSRISSCQGRGYPSLQTASLAFTASVLSSSFTFLSLYPTWATQSVTLSISDNLQDAQSELVRLLAAQVGLRRGNGWHHSCASYALPTKLLLCCLPLCVCLALSPGSVQLLFYLCICCLRIFCIWCNSIFLWVRNAKCYYNTNDKQ